MFKDTFKFLLLLLIIILIPFPSFAQNADDGDRSVEEVKTEIKPRKRLKFSSNIEEAIQSPTDYSGLRVGRMATISATAAFTSRADLD